MRVFEIFCYADHSLFIRSLDASHKLGVRNILRYSESKSMTWTYLRSSARIEAM